MADKPSYDELLSRVSKLEKEVAERETLAQALQESEERYRKLAEHSPIPILVHTEEKVVFINSAAISILGGESAEDFLGRSIWDCVHPDSRDVSRKRVQDIYSKTRSADILEEKFFRLDGTIIDVEVMGNSVDFQGKPSSQVVFRDITEKKKLQAQLIQAQKMEAIGTLAGGIAHDFNNILAAVVGYTEMALEDSRSLPAVQVNLQEVLKAGLRAKDLVKQILAFSRQMQQEFKPLCLDEVVQEAMKLLRASFPATIKIEVDISSDAVVLADSTQMHQVVMNLATNALQEMRDSGGVLTVNLADVRLDTGFTALHPGVSPGDFLKLSVRDTGGGMTPEVQKRIFEPFFTTKQQGEGSGMGLAVVHGIVKDHGGVVIVETELGAGTTITVFLPMLQEKADVDDQEIADLPTGEERILFVDDERTLMELGRQKLERLGYNVTAVDNGVEALALLRSHTQRFDLVITDLTMPELTGYELVRATREFAPGIPVILCSGYSPQVSAKKAEELVVDAILTKPIAIQELARIVRRVLDRAEK